MSGQTSRSYLIIAAAIIIAGVLISASLFVAIGGATKTSTTTTTATQTTTVSQAASTVTTVMTFAWLTGSTICTGTGGYVPCWDFSAYISGDAFIFNCAGQNLLSGPATNQVCTQRVVSTISPHPSYVINITIPSNPSTLPEWANCSWDVQGTAPLQGYGYCVPVNSTAFIMGMPGPPPVGSGHQIPSP